MSRKTMQKKTSTKPLIRYALISLLKEKPLKDITVHEIVEKALVNRSTFYLHYKDKFDLYDSITDELLQNFMETLEKANMVPFKNLMLDYYNQNKPLEITVRLLEHVQENKEYYAIFLLQQNFQKQFINTLSNFIQTYSELPSIITNHIAYGAIGTLIEWVTKDTPYSLHYLANLLSRLAISEILEYKELRIY